MRHHANVTGTDELVAKLKFIGANIYEAGQEAVKEATELLKNESIARSPLDTGDLEECHDSKVHSFKHAKRVVGVVFINDSLMKKTHNIPVSEYAIIMHEHLAPYGSGLYNMRKGSKQKKSAGNDVGGKFLFRALEDNREEINAIIQSRLAEALREAIR